MAFESIVQGGGILTQGFGDTAYGLSCQCEWNCPGHAPYAFHAGIDIAAGNGAILTAVGYGQVVQIGRVTPGPCSGLGPYAPCIRSGPVDIWYGHAQRALVGVGQSVVPGQPIALMGSIGCSTGTHVHYEVLPSGADPNGCSALDPWAYVSRWPGVAPPAPIPIPPPGPPPSSQLPAWILGGGTALVLASGGVALPLVLAAGAAAGYIASRGSR